MSVEQEQAIPVDGIHLGIVTSATSEEALSDRLRQVSRLINTGERPKIEKFLPEIEPARPIIEARQSQGDNPVSPSGYRFNGKVAMSDTPMESFPVAVAGVLKNDSLDFFFPSAIALKKGDNKLYIDIPKKFQGEGADLVNRFLGQLEGPHRPKKVADGSGNSPSAAREKYIYLIFEVSKGGQVVLATPI